MAWIVPLTQLILIPSLGIKGCLALIHIRTPYVCFKWTHVDEFRALRSLGTYVRG